MNRLVRWLLGIAATQPPRRNEPRGIAATGIHAEVHTDRGDLLTGEPTYAAIAGRLITLHLPIHGASPGTILRRSTLYFGTIIVDVPIAPPVAVPADASVTLVHVVEMGELVAAGRPAPEVV